MVALSSPARRRLWLSTLLLLAIAWYVGRQWPDRSLWYDETVNAYFAERGWPEIWEWCTRIDNQVPLHFVLLKLWGEIAGTSEFALRAFSFLCGLLAVGGVMALGRRLGGSLRTGWLAALALALSQSFVFAAFEVRTYGLSLALYAWSGVLLWDLWERYSDRPITRNYWALFAGYILLALGVLYAHYTGVLALAAQGAYLGARAVRHLTRRRIVLLGQVTAGIAAGYVPWLIALAGRDVRAGTAYEGRIEPDIALRTYVEFFAYGQRIMPPDTPRYALFIGLLVIAAALLRWIVGRLERSTIRMGSGLLFALWMTAVPLVGLVIMVWGVQAKLSGRHGWPAWIGAALLTGLGLESLTHLRWVRWARWPVWAGALLLIWLPSNVDAAPVYDSHLREAFDYIRQRAQPGDVLVLRDGTLFTAAGYYDSAVPWIGLPPDKLTDVHRRLFFDEAQKAVSALVEQHDARRVWVIAWQGHIMDPQDLVAGMLEYIGDPQPIERSFGDVFMSLYMLHDSPDTLRTLAAHLKPVVQVMPDGPIYYGGYAVDREPVPHGGIVRIQTWWQRGNLVIHDLRVSVRLYSPDGALYAQLDQPPVNWSFGQEHWLPGTLILSRFMLWVPYEVPAGPVEVRMIIYDMEGKFDPIPVSIDTIEIGD